MCARYNLGMYSWILTSTTSPTETTFWAALRTIGATSVTGVGSVTEVDSATGAGSAIGVGSVTGAGSATGVGSTTGVTVTESKYRFLISSITSGFVYEE